MSTSPSAPDFFCIEVVHIFLQHNLSAHPQLISTHSFPFSFLSPLSPLVSSPLAPRIFPTGSTGSASSSNQRFYRLPSPHSERISGAPQFRPPNPENIFQRPNFKYRISNFKGINLHLENPFRGSNRQAACEQSRFVSSAGKF